MCSSTHRGNSDKKMVKRIHNMAYLSIHGDNPGVETWSLLHFSTYLSALCNGMSVLNQVDLPLHPDAW
jgi:hypothetical protein